MLKVTVKGDFTNTSRYLEKMNHKEFLSKVMTYAEMGTDALEKYTPHDTGFTAQSWYSEIEETADSLTIRWKNSHINKGVPIAIILQQGHGTGTGGYVQGRDYINPALQPVFDNIVKLIQKEVKS
jgi:hypothetical protein